MQMCSGVRSYLLHSVGVQSTSFGPMRYEMLPPLPSTYWRCQSFLPVATISALIRSASGELKSASAGGDATGVPAAPAARPWRPSPREHGAAGPSAWRSVSARRCMASAASGVITAPLRVTISFAPRDAAWSMSFAAMTRSAVKSRALIVVLPRPSRRPLSGG